MLDDILEIFLEFFLEIGMALFEDSKVPENARKIINVAFLILICVGCAILVYIGLQIENILVVLLSLGLTIYSIYKIIAFKKDVK